MTRYTFNVTHYDLQRCHKTCIGLFVYTRITPDDLQGCRSETPHLPLHLSSGNFCEHQPLSISILYTYLLTGLLTILFKSIANTNTFERLAEGSDR